MCRVLNKHHAGVPAGAVYIGRGSMWGDPFRIGRDGEQFAGKKQAATKDRQPGHSASRRRVRKCQPQ
jgi:Domain of unknown function (DUF4326)